MLSGPEGLGQSVSQGFICEIINKRANKCDPTIEVYSRSSMIWWYPATTTFECAVQSHPKKRKEKKVHLHLGNVHGDGDEAETEHSRQADSNVCGVCVCACAPCVCRSEVEAKEPASV